MMPWKQGTDARLRTVASCRWTGFGRGSSAVALGVGVLLTGGFGNGLWAQDPGLVSRMAANELAAHQQNTRFSYASDERSVRTGGHLWRERVVETDDGPLRRLMAVDGRPLSPAEAKAENDRIAGLVSHPEQFRRENQMHQEDETHATQLLQLLPKAFLVTGAGEQDGCTRFSFRPNPAFQPSSFEERVVAAMGGTVSLQQPMNRLCQLSATILQPVEFGFGFLGRVEAGGHFSLARMRVTEATWKTDHISVHMQGRVLLMKSLTREQETVRSEMRVIAPHLPLGQAAQLSLP